MTRVSVLGMGLLGAGFAEGLLARGGSTVVVWNRTPAKCEPLVALGATAAPSAAEAVRGAQRVHLVLLDDDSVERTLAECQAALHPDAIVIDTRLPPPNTCTHVTMRLSQHVNLPNLNIHRIQYTYCSMIMIMRQQVNKYGRAHAIKPYVDYKRATQ